MVPHPLRGPGVAFGLAPAAGALGLAARAGFYFFGI
jgi:hypothetical protein